MTVFELFSLAANFSTAATFILGLFLYWRQKEHQTALTSAQLIVSLVDQYNSPHFISNRQVVAKKLAHHISGDYDFSPTDFSMPATLFENVCYLSNRSVIDVGMVRNIFGFAIFNYYHILRFSRQDLDVIAVERKTGEDTYIEIEKFYRHYRSLYPDIDARKTIQEYLEMELQLEDRGSIRARKSQDVAG